MSLRFAAFNKIAIGVAVSSNIKYNDLTSLSVTSLQQIAFI